MRRRGGVTAIGTVIATMVLVVSGCGSSSEAPPPNGEQDTTADEGEQTVDATLEEELRFEQFGGIAGREDALVITPEGDAELTTRVGDPVSFALDDEQRSELAGHLAAADLPAQPEEIPSSDQVDDAILYVIEVGDDRVRVRDVELPEEMRPLVVWLTTELEERRPRP